MPGDGVNSTSLREAYFADTVILVEGISDVVLLSGLATRPQASGAVPHIDLDRKNVVLLPVGSKEVFVRHTDLLDSLGVKWRLVADNDALMGASLSEYASRAGVATENDPIVRMNGLRLIGVGVLSDGEIENYYPPEVLAELANLDVAEFKKRCEVISFASEEPRQIAVIQEMFVAEGDQLVKLQRDNGSRFPKELEKAYNRARQKVVGLRGERRKYSEVVCQILKMSKPRLAKLVTERLIAAPERIPPKLVALVDWLFDAVKRANHE